MDIPYQIGQEYNRRIDLHERFGGSRQSGMSPCAHSPIIFLFTGPGGEQHGYQDRFADDGRFFYTGEGQVGDMAFTKGNKALRDHVPENRHALLFEQTKKAHCRFIGEVAYIGHHFETRPDRAGSSRQAIVFELAMEPLSIAANAALEPTEEDLARQPIIPKTLSILELRQLAISGSSSSVKSRTIQNRLYYRSAAVKRYALARASGNCECCGSPAPFLNRQKEPYLEVHHLFRVADGGPDSPEGVAAICPSCHRNIHNGINGNSLNLELSQKIGTKCEIVK